MSSFARKARRKNIQHDTSNKSCVTVVKHATAEQIIHDHSIISEIYDNLMIVLDVAVHRSFGWGKKLQAKLHAKMARHLQCMRSRLVTTPDIEKILREETGLKLRKRHLNDETWNRNRRLQYNAVNDISAVFLLSLKDEFGYSKIRLKRVYEIARDMSHELSTGNTTLDSIRKEWEAIR